MKNFNVSAWSIRHPAMVTYLIIVLMIAGALAYFKLGRAEDPDFTFRVMVVRTLWPGATAEEVQQQVSERIEKKLQETSNLDFVRSSSKPGESLIFITLKEGHTQSLRARSLAAGAAQAGRYTHHPAHGRDRSFP
jgi:multidrug efflux pump